jgi:opacity protein-like surface antigen
MKTHRLLAAAIAGLAFSAAASAQTYAVISAGTGKHDLDCAGAATCDETGGAFKLMGGYRFMPNVAGEFGVMSFGKARAADPGVALAVTTTGVGGGVAFHSDLGTNWNFVARLGLAQVKTKIDATLSGVSASDSDNNIQLYAGLGVGYKLAKNVSLDLAYDSSKAKYDKSGVNTSGNVSAFSLGMTFGF